MRTGKLLVNFSKKPARLHVSHTFDLWDSVLVTKDSERPFYLIVIISLLDNSA